MEYSNTFELSGIRDRYGNLTSIERTGSGVANSITSSYGQSSLLTVGENGFLEEVIDPTGSKWSTVHSDGGALMSFVNRRGATNSFEYNSDGTLLTDTNAVGGVQRLLSPVS